MPWKQSSAMSLRHEFIHFAMTANANIRQLCRRFTISPKTGYKWIERFRDGGIGELSDRSRRPHHSPLRTSTEIEQLIVELRKQHPVWGARKLRARLLALGHQQLPSPGTITAILYRHGCIDPLEAEKHQAFKRFEAAAPNLMWQMDFKGYFSLSQGRCHPLTILDDFSRFSLALFACSNQTLQTVQKLLITTFRRYGLPLRLLTDNGGPWGSSGYDAYSVLGVWLMRLGIYLSHSRIYHPQTLGKDERFHRTLKTELIARRSFSSLEECQNHFDRWRHLYNFERPHQALPQMAVPASRYQPSSRSYPESLPPIDYNTYDIVRKVDDKGDVSFHGRNFRIGKAFAGYPVALRLTLTRDIYNVFFCHQQIAKISLNDDISDV